ncbi:type I phosphodiesterase / nucleotide pyrophosphatase [Dictyocaulus viviparus]|uniref:Type I phosphodiesterase / nucleotide pyrophosphatase n=1 Tax=Dictyocaulus viviparus TaxID=29172 RepID=A0A0D8Y284_DICVI|nr:type I phosphodiesterase / nucleotide pyrophosphatase [Dictyocaulus viviparus]
MKQTYEDICIGITGHEMLITGVAMFKQYHNRGQQWHEEKRNGRNSERVYPSFPSRTFPNHYTIVTGLYPESHGIVDNNVYDAKLSDTIESMKNTRKNGFGMFINVMAAEQRASSGQDVPTISQACTTEFSIILALFILGLQPDITLPYNKDLPFRNRFDMIVNWLLLPQKLRPGLITAYIDEPDSAGHYQMDDTDIKSKLSQIDNRLWYLLERLRNVDILRCVNLAIVSDHDSVEWFQNIAKKNGYGSKSEECVI